MERFHDRTDAGARLAEVLRRLRVHDVVVLGLPRGGVPVAAEVARALGAPLDVIIVRKLGIPGHPEVAMGAIGEGGARILDDELIARAGVSAEQVAAVEQEERARLEDRVERLRSGRERIDLADRTVVIVDDGIATGATATVACTIARRLGARRVIVAAPVGGRDAAARVRGADDVVCVLQPRDFAAVGAHYEDFTQTTDAEVMRLLHAAQ